MNYTALKIELAKPVYLAMTDSQAANHLNTTMVAGPEREVVPSHEILEATVPSEWNSLTSTEKQRYQTITGAGSVNLKGSNTRAALAAMFGAGTQTRANLTALQAGPQVPLWQSLGLGEPVGDGHVKSARAMP